MQIGAHREFGTTFAIYTRATGKGTIKDLFADDKPETDPPQLQRDEVEKPKPQRQDTVSFAQNVMDQNTTKLDYHGT